MVSVVIPTFQELKSRYLRVILERYKEFPNIEVIVVDGGSSDGTQGLITSYGYKYIELLESSRAERLNAGIRAATGDLILLNHPRSFIEKEGLQFLLDHHKHLLWGGFTHRFDLSHPLLKFTSWYSNKVRSEKKGILYLDHCIFFRKKLIDSPQFVPEIDIFEDTALSLKLRSHGFPRLLPHFSITSAVRFKKNGYLYQSLMNQCLKIGYNLNLPHKSLNAFYEKGLSLNSKIRF